MTDTQLKHDPRTKSQIRDVLYDYLYKPVRRKFRRELDEIVVANTRALASSYACFVYRNGLYKKSDFQGLPPRPANRLVKGLQDRMETYLHDLGQVNQHELPYVMGFINNVLNSSDDLKDYLQVFPSVLHPPLNQMIDKCPCKSTKLAPEAAEEMRDRNQHSIELIKQRLAYNLLLQ